MTTLGRCGLCQGKNPVSLQPHSHSLWLSCELLMTGEGHSDWLSHAAFHPSYVPQTSHAVKCLPLLLCSGHLLATTSGDGSVKLWDFSRACCSLTLSDHTQPGTVQGGCEVWGVVMPSAVWQCSWHWNGQFLASGGMDHCCKLWDTVRGVCVSTLRGHSDSVNAVNFLPFSNSLLSASADNTLSLWDIRTVCLSLFPSCMSNTHTHTLPGAMCSEVC